MRAQASDAAGRHATYPYPVCPICKNSLATAIRLAANRLAMQQRLNSQTIAAKPSDKNSQSPLGARGGGSVEASAKAPSDPARKRLKPAEAANKIVAALLYLASEGRWNE